MKTPPYKNPIYIIGCTNESINACILLATLEYQVVLLCDKTALQQVISDYQFDRQMVLLWQLYQTQGDIITQEFSQPTISNLQQVAQIWLFTDELPPHILAQFSKLHFNPTTQILLSGATAVGKIAQLAKTLTTTWVYYLPFIFMKDGANFRAFFQADFVLMGEKTPDSANKSPILRFFMGKSNKHFISDIQTAEFARSGIMGMLATRLSFMNEMARLADSEGINIKTVEQILGLDSRIGKDYLKAGWGFGGKSLPCELDFLIEKFEQNQVENALLKSVKAINEDQKELLFRKFWQYFDGFIEDKTVLIWGAGYRNGTGRTTNSAIHPLLNLLWSYNIKTIVYANNTAEELLELYSDNPLFSLTPSAYDDLENAHALFILNWSHPNLPEIHQINAVGLPIFDGKNILTTPQISQLVGFYTGIGC